jgi:hypothetical protein
MVDNRATKIRGRRVLSKGELTKLSLTEKRQILKALLQSKFNAPRSFALSYAQEQLWFMDKLQPGSPVYNIPLYIPFEGSLDVATLKNALDTLTQRHDMLRVHFDTVDDEPRQIVEPAAPVHLVVEDLSRLAPEQRHDTLGQLLNEEAQKPFALTGLCVRYKLFRLDVANHLLTVTMHHIITDAWSLGVFVLELRKVYEAYRSRQQSTPLAPLHIEYADYVQWQRASLHGLRLSKLVNYWTNQLSGAPHVLRLPTDYPRPKDQTFNGTVIGFVFNDELSEALISLCRLHKVTPFMLMLACYYTLLYRYTGQEDIVIGAPVANRGHPELEPIIGIFVNTLILRVKLQHTQTFADLVKDVQRMSLDAFEHQALPFEKLINELNVERVPGYPPLYQVVFNFQNASLIESSNPLPEGEAMINTDFPFVHSNTSKVDLNLTLTQNGSTLSGGIEYNTDLFESGTINDMISHFQIIAEKIVIDPLTPIVDIPLADHVYEANADGHRSEKRDAEEQAQLMESGKFTFELTD